MDVEAIVDRNRSESGWGGGGGGGGFPAGERILSVEE
jgi:hypothetical protein